MVEQWEDKKLQFFNNAYKVCEHVNPKSDYLNQASSWKNIQIPLEKHKSVWNTGCSTAELLFVGAKSVEVPINFVSI